MPKRYTEWWKSLPENIWGSSAQNDGVGYTGAGPDGIVQPNKPIALMQAQNGPVMVHEGEGMIQNGNNTQIVPQSKLAQMESNYQGMALGGNFITSKFTGTGPGYTPTNPLKPKTMPAIPVPTTPPTPSRESRSVSAGDTGGRQRNTTTTTRMPPTQEPVSTGFTDQAAMLENTGSGRTPNMQDSTGLGMNSIGGSVTQNAHNELPMMVTSQNNTQSAPEFNPITQTMVTPQDQVVKADEFKITEPNDNYYQKGMDVLAGAAEGTGPIYENIYNRAIGEYGGASAAARGAMKQEAAQAGLSEGETTSLLATQARDIAGEGAKLRGDLANQQQGIAINAANNLANYGLAERRQDFAEKAQEAEIEFRERGYNDAQTSRAITDIASGRYPDYESFKADYPNISEAAYNSMTSLSTEPVEGQATDYFTKMSNVPGWDWKTDPTALDYASRMWQQMGGQGTFNMDIPEHAQWFENQLAPITTSAYEQSVSEMKNESWFQAKSPEEQQALIDLANKARELVFTGGFEMKENPDSTVYYEDQDGNVIGEKKTNENVDIDNAAETSDKILEDTGELVSVTRVAQWQAENPGKDPNVVDIVKWDQQAGKPENIRDYFAGNLDTLDNNDKKLLDKIIESKAVPEDKRTDTQKFYAGMIDGDLIESSFKTEPKSTYRRKRYAARIGNHITELKLNRDVYDKPDLTPKIVKLGKGIYKSEYEVSFNEETKKMVEGMAGQRVKIGDNWYIVDKDNPIGHGVVKVDDVKSGNDYIDYIVNADYINVININGEPEKIDLGISINAED